MNLQQLTLHRHKENKINEFKNKYPEVYNWFQGDYFVDTLAENLHMTIRWTYHKQGQIQPLVCLGLPVQDSEGVVDIEDVAEYLKLEGFDCEIIRTQGAYRQLTALKISV